MFGMYDCTLGHRRVVECLHICQAVGTDCVVRFGESHVKIVSLSAVPDSRLWTPANFGTVR